MDDYKAVAAAKQQELQQEQHEPQTKADPQDSLMDRFFFSLLCFIACFLVAVNFAQTTYRVRRNSWDLAFVLASYAILALLFYCIEKFHTLVAADPPIGDSRKNRLKLSVWVLSTALTAMFTARIAPIMPPPLNLLVVLMSLLVTILTGLACSSFATLAI